MRPTPRTVHLFLLSVPLALALVLADPGTWPAVMVLTAGLIALIGLDAALALAPHTLEIDQHWPDSLYVGETDPVWFRLRVPPGSRPTVAEILADLGPDLIPDHPRLALLSADQPPQVAVPLTPMRRGEMVVERLWLRWTGPLGLTWRRRSEPLDRSVPAVPNIRAVKLAAARFFARDALFGLKVQDQLGDGTEFDALREWVPGLDHRAIDWKASARHRMLVCKEYQAERNHHLMMALDSGHLMRSPLSGIPRLDHAINAALLLTFVSLKAGDLVGLYGFDATVRLHTAPQGGMQAFPRLQRSSATLDYHLVETNFTLGLAELANRLTRRTLVILFTEFVDTVTAELMLENVQRLAARHVVVFVSLQDPILARTIHARPKSVAAVARAAVADSFLHDRLVVLERLRRMGVHCLDVPHDKLSMDLVNTYLSIKRRALI